MKKMRKLHLWIGLVTSLLLFIEAGTGLLLMEPWLIGVEKREHGPREGEFDGRILESSGNTDSSKLENRETFGKPDREDEGAFGIIKGLHEGRIGDIDISLVIDLTAISIMFLTATGIYLSIKILKAENKSKKRKNQTQDILTT